jgi:hypothetical protein
MQGPLLQKKSFYDKALLNRPSIFQTPVFSQVVTLEAPTAGTYQNIGCPAVVTF